MSKYTKEDILRKALEEDKVKFVRLQFSDIFGMVKNVTITPTQLKKCLDNKCMFDGSSIEGFVRIEESDMYLYPDLDTYTIYVPDAEKTARIICDVYTTAGTPFEGDPRYILKKVLKDAEDMGYGVNCGPECEFFLFDNDADGHPTINSGDKGGYFDMSPMGLGGACRRDITMALEDMDFDIETSHHECAPAQHEIDFKYSDALKAADRISTFRMVVKSIALRRNLHATFMPKPKFGIAGSGMHINLSLTSLEDGANIFYDPADVNGLSQVAYSFMAGIMANIKGITAITNPLVNSYKRLIPDHEAPVYIAWSAKNRSPLVRVPFAKGPSTRIELRSPDPSCNPYLALAVVIAAGLDGIKKGLKAPQSVDKNIFSMTQKELDKLHIECLPLTLIEAVNQFEKSKLAKEILGEHIFNKYLDAKKKEWEEYRLHVSEWEVDSYLAKY